MNELIEFRNEVTKLSNEEDDFMDSYYTLTLNCDIRLITDRLTDKQRFNLLIKCGITPEEIEYYNNFDTNYQNNLEYIIRYSKYDSIRYRIYAYLFSFFTTSRIKGIEQLLE